MNQETKFSSTFLKLSQFFEMQPEGIAIDARKLLLRRASRGVTNFTMNKNSGMIEC
uniref:Uncharacterized protein n=2 Tax=Aegilops tauschii subsp. strangulata TaxID=200361 RepID=A0A453KAX4_AEGTS